MSYLFVGILPACELSVRMLMLYCLEKQFFCRNVSLIVMIVRISEGTHIAV